MNRYLLLALGSGLILALDLLTKFFAQKLLTSPIEILPFFSLEFTKNENLAFGIPFPRVLTILLSILAISFFIWIYVKNVKKESKMGLIVFALLLGGSLGNLVERILFREVSDFISLATIPNFNLADASLTISIALIIIFSKKIFRKNF